MHLYISLLPPTFHVNRKLSIKQKNQFPKQNIISSRKNRLLPTSAVKKKPCNFSWVYIEELSVSHSWKLMCWYMQKRECIFDRLWFSQEQRSRQKYIERKVVHSSIGKYGDLLGWCPLPSLLSPHINCHGPWNNVLKPSRYLSTLFQLTALLEPSRPNCWKPSSNFRPQYIKGPNIMKVYKKWPFLISLELFLAKQSVSAAARGRCLFLGSTWARQTKADVSLVYPHCSFCLWRKTLAWVETSYRPNPAFGPILGTKLITVKEIVLLRQ